MLAFLALTYFMGMLPRCNVKDYWTVDEVMSTPFPGTVVSRNEFMVILSFLRADNIHLLDDAASNIIFILSRQKYWSRPSPRLIFLAETK